MIEVPATIQDHTYIGKWYKSGNVAVADIKTPADYLKFLYPNGARGFAVICFRSGEKKFFCQRFFHYDQINDRNLSQFVGQDDIYISMNLFLSKQRMISNVKRLTALFVDLDCYKLGLTPEHVVELLSTRYFGIVVPYPSAIIFSGRGVQIVWRISEDRLALPRWERVEKYLRSALSALGADPKATDATRVLRMPFTHNSKGGDVRIQQISDVTYTLSEIIREYKIPADLNAPAHKKSRTPFGTATPKQRIAATSIAKRLGVACPNFENYEETSEFIRNGLAALPNSGHRERKRMASVARPRGDMGTILKKRLQDLVTLAGLRQGPDCGRENILFLARLWAGESTGNYAHAIEFCRQVNRTFSCPLDENEFLRATASAEKKLRSGSTYHYSDRKVIETLEITPEEQSQLLYFNAGRLSAQKAETQRQQKRLAYQAKLDQEGRERKGERIRRAVEELAVMLAHGMTREQICDALHIGRSTFYRYKAMLERDTEKIQPRQETEEDQAACAKTAPVPHAIKKYSSMLKNKKALNTIPAPKKENQVVHARNFSCYYVVPKILPPIMYSSPKGSRLIKLKLSLDTESPNQVEGYRKYSWAIHSCPPGNSSKPPGGSRASPP